MTIAGKLGIKPPRVNTYNLMDNAFEWKRVRLYEEVQENLETLEHFEDDLNLNITSQRLVKNFIRAGKAIAKNLREKYGSAFAF